MEVMQGTFMNNNDDISNLVGKLRYELGLTQEQFAQKVGVTFSTINNWENGNRKPHPYLFNRLLEIADEAGLENANNKLIARKQE